MSVPQVETPMMRQFNAIKREHPDKLLFYRMGDFYEMFGDDAIVGAKVLQIALTSRDKKKSLPMCGVPYRAYEAQIVSAYLAGKLGIIIFYLFSNTHVCSPNRNTNDASVQCHQTGTPG